MRWLLAPLLLLLFSSLSNADSRSAVAGYQLDNGMGMLFKPTHERSHVSIRLIVGVGFADFSCSERQLPHLMEHLFFSGLDGGDEAGLEARMQALGGQWNAFTSEGDTAFVIEAPASTQRQVLDLLLEAITHTELDSRKIASAKQVLVREDGGRYSHLQRWLDHENISRAGQEQLAVELGLNCAERPQVDRLSQAQLEQLRKDWYVPSNMTLIVVGDLDPKLPLYVNHTFGKLPDHQTPDRRELPTMHANAQQRRTLTTGMFGENAVVHWIFPEPEAADGTALTLLQSYMDDALYSELRVRSGLSYGPWSERTAWSNQGFLSLNADVERDDEQATEAALHKVVEDIRTNGLDPDRFYRIKKVARAQLAWSTPSNAALADYYWGALSDFDNGHFPDEDRRLAKVSLKDANETARQLFKGDGYLRVEKPLMDDDMVYPLGFAAVLLGGGLVWIALRRRKSAAQ